MTAPLPAPLVKPNIGPIAPMTNVPDQTALVNRPNEFVFKSHFDEEGALYYLGSFGKKRLYQNPHTVG